MAQAVAVRRVAKGDWIKPRPRLVRIMVAGDPRYTRGSPDVRASLPLFAVMTRPPSTGALTLRGNAPLGRRPSPHRAGAAAVSCR